MAFAISGSHGARATLRLVLPICPDEYGRPLPTRPLARMTPGQTLRLVLAALTIAQIVWLFVACAAGRPTSLIRLPEGYEVLTAHCEASPPETCQHVRVTGDPADEEAWGFRARPAANALWKESEVFYAVGDRARCDQVRAALRTPTEACWGPVYFRRQ